MAFGAANSDEIQILVDLITRDATQAAEAFKQGLVDGMKEAAREVEKVEREVGSVGTAAQRAASESSTAFDKLSSALKGAAGIAATVTGAFLGIKKVLDDGDAFNDVRGAFDEMAASAGVASDVLLGTLNEALERTVSNLDLMVLANRAVASGVPVDALDEVAFAARRYAERTGGDAVQATEQLIQALKTGRETALKPFGIAVQDGVVSLKQLTAGEVAAANATGGASAALGTLTKALSDAYSGIAAGIDGSQEYARYLRALGETAGFAASVLKGAFGLALKIANGLASVTAPVLERLNALLGDLARGIAVVGKIADQVGSGKVPSLSEAIGDVAGEMAAAQKAGRKTGDVVFKVGTQAGEAAKKLKTLEKAVSDALEQSDVDLAQSLGFEAFTLGDGSGSLQDEITKALKQVDPNAILASLKGVRAAFLDGITGTPEEIAAETQKRLGIFGSEVARVGGRLDGPYQSAVNRAELGAAPSQRVQGSAVLQGADLLGIDTEAISDEIAAGLERALSAALGSVMQAVFEDFGREDVPQLAEDLGEAIGGMFGPLFALVGKFLGRALGELIEDIGGDLAGTTERKKVDAYFAELFDAERVAAVVGGQLTRVNDLVFEGTTPVGGDVDFGGARFFDVLNAAGREAAAGFTGVGAAFGELAGIAEEQSRLIGAALANNVGTELENLRALVAATGESFETLSDAMLRAFYDGVLTVEELYNGMKRLEEVFSVGFPDAVGDVQRAVDNLQAAVQDGRGSRQLFDSIRDAAQEAVEAGLGFDALVAQLGSALGLTAQQAVVLMEFLKNKGIDTAEELREASVAELVALLEAARRIVGAGQDVAAGAAAAGQVTVPTDPTADREAPGLFTRGGPRAPAGGGGGGSRGANAADQRKRELERQREELYRLLTQSQQYADVLDALEGKTLDNAQASRQIRELYREIEQATKGLERAEKAYRDALEKRGKSQKEVAGIAARVDQAQQRLDDLTKRAKDEAANAIPKFDVSGAVQLTQTVNELAVVARAAGVNLQGMTNTLVDGFLRGKVGITDFRTELDKLEETFAAGIPNAVGAVDEAVRNLFEGGRNGGVFSTDALQDIFAEYEELFSARSSESRKRQLAQLTKEFDEANAALQAAIGGGATPGTVDGLREQFEGARKALEDFKSVPNKAGLDDLRNELERVLSPDQSRAFFKALEDNGVTTFEQIRTAGPEALARVLASLDELGFGFGETSDRVRGIISNLDAAATAQTKGKDVLQEALTLVTSFNQFSGQLPAVFSSTATQVEAMNGPLAAVATQVSDLFAKLEQLGGREFNADVVLNVRAEGQSGAVNLVDVLFGDGGGSSDGAGGDGPGLTRRQRRRYTELRRKKKTGTLTRREQDEFERLEGLR